MSQLITLTKIATLVSESTGVELSICEAFIRNMAQTAASGLIEGEHIRIKDFGLFELRHSVDGAPTVEFIPESVFAERVNTPYAHLRPTELPKQPSNSQAGGDATSHPDKATQPMAQGPAFRQQPEMPAYAPQQPEMPQEPAFPQQPEMPAYAQQQGSEIPQGPAFPQQPEMPAYAQQQTAMPQGPAFPQQPEMPAYAQQQTAMPQGPAFPQQPEMPAYAQQQTAMPQGPTFPQQPETPAYAQQQTAMPQGPAFPQQPEMPAYAQQQTAMPQRPAFQQQPEMPAYAQQQTAMPQGPAFQQQETSVFPNQNPEFPLTPGIPTSGYEGASDSTSYINLPGAEQTQTSPKPEQASSTDSSGSYYPSGYNRPLPQISTNKKYVLIGLLGILVGFILGYLTARYSSGNDQEAPKDNQESAETPEAATSLTAPEYDYNSALSVADVDTILEDNDSNTAPEAQPEPQTITVKLQKGQRLSDLANKYYGHKEYWVYIYLENRENISNPFMVREGMTLRIPPKDKFAPTTDEATNLAWAKSKGAEINNKYIN